MSSVRQNGNDKEQMHLHHWPSFDGHGGAQSNTDGIAPGLLRKPLDTAIGELLALYCLSGHQVDYFPGSVIKY
jgi:hypothetical protein